MGGPGLGALSRHLDDVVSNRAQTYPMSHAFRPLREGTGVMFFNLETGRRGLPKELKPPIYWLWVASLKPCPPQFSGSSGHASLPFVISLTDPCNTPGYAHSASLCVVFRLAQIVVERPA